MTLSKHHSYHEERSQPPQGREASDDRFLAVVQASADVFWLLTPAGEMHEISPSWYTFTGQTECDGLGQHWLDAVHPADQSQIAETVLQAVTTGSPKEMECHIRRCDGTYRLLRVRAIPVRTIGGTLREVVVCGTDITQQELAAQMSEAQVQLAVKTSGVGTWDWDLITNQILWTDQCKALLGQAPDTSINYEGFLAALHPDDRERVDRLIARALAEHTKYQTEYRVIWPDGSMHWLIDRGKHLYDLYDKPRHMIGAMLDITAMKQAEEQGQEANRQRRAILESITDAFLHVDAQWRFTYVNQRMEEYLEKKRDDLLGKSVWDVLPQLHGTSFESHTHHAMATQQVAHFETQQFWRERRFDIHVYPAQSGLSVYMQDITERRGAEEALRESKEELRLLTETIPQLVWTALPNGFVDCFNEQCTTYLGAKAEHLTGEQWIEAVHPDDRYKTRTIWQTALQTGHAYAIEYRLREGKTGDYHWFLGRATPLTDDQGHILKWYGTATAIDENKRTEEALRQSRDAFRLLTEAMPQLVWTARPDGSQEYLNQQWYDYTGSTPEQSLGEGWISSFHPNDQQRILALWYASLLTSQPFDIEARIRQAKTGRYRWFLVRAVPLMNTSGSVWKWFGTCTDIHEQKCTAESLQESEARFRALVESNLIGITVATLEGTVLEANEAFLSLVGYTQQDVAAGRVQWTAMTPSKYQERNAQAIEELRATGMFQPFEKAYVAKDGTHVPVLVGGTRIRQPGADPLVLGFIVDLSARQAAEEQRQEAHQRITTILESITDAFSHVDTQWRYTYVNQGWEKLMEKKREEVVGRSLWDMIPKVSGTPFEHAYREAMATRQTRHVEGFHPDFRRWLDIRIYPASDGLSFYLHDITERKQAEEALRESEARFRGLVDSNLIGITVSEPEGTICEANEAFLDLVGYTQDDVAAGQMQWQAITPLEYQAQHRQILKELLATGKVQPFEKELVTKDGRRVPVLVGRTLFQREKATPLVIGFVLDQTARKEMERRKDLMLGMTSHELKTPLTTLKGTFQLLQRRVKRLGTKTDQLSPEVSAFLNDLSERLVASARQVDVQTHLINDLLDVSRISAQTLKLELEPCDLIPLVRETVEDLRVTAPNRSLLLELPEHAPVKVLADRNRISQVVANYVTNAIRYSSSDQPVSIGLTLQENTARVWVQDKGPGLTAEAQKELWQCFHQVKGVPIQSGSGKGLGLGLYICQTLIAGHQGEVGVESTPGEGSTFWFTLPLFT